LSRNLKAACRKVDVEANIEKTKAFLGLMIRMSNKIIIQR
jgi:hypothetical protein